MNRICVLTVLLILSTVSLAQQVESAKYQRMLKKRLPKDVPTINVSEIGDNDETILFLDARERNEYEVSHIKNAKFIGYKDVDLDAILLLPKTTEIVVYCSVGYRSGKITEQLMEHGFSNVRNLYGGIFEWSNQERTMVDSDGNPTTLIHAYNKKWGKWITTGSKVYD